MNVEVVQSSMFRGGLRKDFEDRTVEVIGMNKYFTPRRKEESKDAKHHSVLAQPWRLCVKQNLIKN